MHLHFTSQSPSQSASAVPVVLATPAAVPATVPPSAPAMQAMLFAAASVGPAAAPEQANSADPQPESHNVADDEMDTHPDNFAILHSYSSEIAPPPDMLVDPRVAGDMFVGVLVHGRPVGLVLDINLFFKILRTQSDIWYRVFFNWREAYGYYQAQYSNGLVQITPLLKAPLPTLLPALVQSNHPAIDPFLSTPTTSVEAAASFLIHRSGSGSGSDEGSDGSSDGSPEEEDNGDVKAGKGKQKAVLVTREDDPTLAHIPTYPKFPSSTISARLMTPHLDLTTPQTAPTTASDPRGATPFAALYPFPSAPPMSVPFTASNKHLDRPMDGETIDPQSPASKKKRRQIIEDTLNNLTASGSKTSEPMPPPFGDYAATSSYVEGTLFGDASSTPTPLTQAPVGLTSLTAFTSSELDLMGPVLGHQSSSTAPSNMTGDALGQPSSTNAPPSANKSHVKTSRKRNGPK